MCPTTTAQAQGQNQILKIAPTYKIGSKELIVTDSTTKEEITYQLAVIAKKHGATLALEGSNTHILYRDSLTLYNLFHKTESLGQKATTKVDKAGLPTGKPCITDEQEKKLYYRFKDYIEGKVQWAGDHTVRHGLIRQERHGSIVVYYTELTNKYPAVVAYRPGIEPSGYRYLRNQVKNGSCYDSAELLSLGFYKPKAEIITIAPSQCKKRNIHTGDISKVNQLAKRKTIPKPVKKKQIAPTTTTPIPTDTLEKLKVEEIDKAQEIFSGQRLNINKSELVDGMIIVRDYGKDDGDKIEVEGKEYALGANEIEINTRLTGDMIVLEITSEGTQSPGTLELHRGTTHKKIAGKKGDIILIQLEE
ncbi:MAG: hypothetical protein WC004_01870 [Candidatus Absconditabacterales bacterium]